MKQKVQPEDQIIFSRFIFSCLRRRVKYDKRPIVWIQIECIFSNTPCIDQNNSAKWIMCSECYESHCNRKNETGLKVKEAGSDNDEYSEI